MFLAGGENMSNNNTTVKDIALKILELNKPKKNRYGVEIEEDCNCHKAKKEKE